MNEPPSLDMPDTLGVWEAAATWPEQLSGALDAARRAFEGSAPFEATPFRAVAAFGLGTGGTACAATAALSAPGLGVPFWVGHDAEVPAFVDATTLVFAVSCSGGTVETLDAAAAAVARGATVVAVGGGPDGSLARLAEEAGLPWCPVSPGAGPARAALGAAVVPLLVALGRAGLGPDCGAAVDAASAALARRRDALLATGGPSAELARRIGRTIPLVYGAAGVAAVAAGWWKARVNLNAKTPAFAAAVPALTHDELAGWGQGGDVTRQTMSLVLLRHAGEGPRRPASSTRCARRPTRSWPTCSRCGARVDDDLSRFFDLALVGELVSLHLAGHEGVDPGPVPAVDDAQAEALRSV